MPLRQIEVVIPDKGRTAFNELLNDDSVEHLWQDTSEDGSAYHLKVMVDASKTEQFLDKAESLLGGFENYRLVVFAVEATLPRLEEDDEEEADEEGAAVDDRQAEKELNPWEKPLVHLRVSREELYSRISDNIKLTRVYLAMVILSTIVASFGLLRDNTAVVIGAMVIAPLLGPNVGLALATSLGDLKLGIRSLKSNLAGLVVSLLISVFMGMFVDFGSEISDIYNISSRTEVQLSDIALALASGSAGVLAYTAGMSAAVIGVMVAVALLPPLVAAGLLLGDMQWTLSLYAFLLLVTNVICVNLAAVTTFMVQGVRPRTWYDTKKAEKANRYALSLWISLLVILAAIIYYTQPS